jgi:hypothetical protein
MASVQDVALAASGTLLTWISASASDTLTNDGRVIVVAQNGATGSTTVTVAANQTITGANLSVPNLVVSVSASTTIAIGPLPKATFNAASSVVTISYANSATLEIALIGY